MEVLSKLHCGTLDLTAINRGWICLIPKKIVALDVREGHSLLDNFFTAHILTHHLSVSGQWAALFKIDFERAFDQVNWSFLLDLLRA